MLKIQLARDSTATARNLALLTQCRPPRSIFLHRLSAERSACAGPTEDKVAREGACGRTAGADRTHTDDVCDTAFEGPTWEHGDEIQLDHAVRPRLRFAEADDRERRPGAFLIHRELVAIDQWKTVVVGREVILRRRKNEGARVGGGLSGAGRKTKEQKKDRESNPYDDSGNSVPDSTHLPSSFPGPQLLPVQICRRQPYEAVSNYL